MLKKVNINAYIALALRPKSYRKVVSAYCPKRLRLLPKLFMPIAKTAYAYWQKPRKQGICIKKS